MKNIKRFLSLALALVLVLTCIPATVLAVSNVAKNIATGKTYASVSAALLEATNGQTVALQAPASELTITVFDGLTLDLNGYTLTASYASAFGDIIDSSEGNTGVLAVAADRLFIREDNAQMPIHNGIGYQFVEVLRIDTRMINPSKFAFQPRFEPGMLELLKKGSDVTGITIQVQVSWTDTVNNGKRTQLFEYNDSLLLDYLGSYKPDTDKYGKMFALTIFGAADYEELSFTAMAVSDSGVIAASEPLYPNGKLPQQTIEFEAEKPTSKVVDTQKRTDVNGASMDHSYRQNALHTDGLHYVDSARTKIFFCAFDSYTYEFTSQEEGSYYLYIVASCDRNTPITYTYGNVTKTGHFASNKYESYEQVSLGLIDVVKGKNTVKLTITENKNHNVWVDKYVLVPAHIVDGEKNNHDWDPILNAKDQLEAPRTETTNAVWKELYVATNGKDTNDGSKNSPFASIPAALKKVSSLRSQMQGDIVINIASGVYTITEPIVLNANNGGINNYRVILRGDAKDKPILSGGVKVTGWSKVTGMDGVWSAPLDVVDTRTLYINDQMATRARSEYLYVGDKNYQTTSSKSDGIILTSRSFPKMTNLSDIELVFDSEWQCHRYPVANIIYGYSGSKYQIAIEMQQPYWNALYNTSKMAPNDPGYNKGFYIENAIELLDEPGEFYYNKAEKRIYYMPFAEENMTTAECYVGVYEYLLQITGTQSNMVSGVTLENLQFKYGAWLEVSEKGMLNNQADNNKNTTNRDGASIMIPGQVSVEWTKNLTVRNCVFSCLGSTALKLTEGVTDSLIDGNVFTNISGSAVSIGKDNHNTSMAKAPARIDVTNNVIRRIGAEYRSCPAIIMYYVTNNRVMHNDIAHIPYTGISLGWGWGKDVKECKDNVIAYNKIVDVAWPTNDGAHIYVLSPNYNTYINNNYCSGSGDIRGGVYPDEGSAHLNIFHNVLEDMTLYWLYARPGVYLRDINAFQNYSDTDKIHIDERNVIVDDNTVITNGQWPAEAQAIINNAGVSAEYKGLLNGVELPSWHTDFGKNVPENYES